MRLITEEYRAQQAALHASNPGYGMASELFAPTVAKLIESRGASELLDYGAGKGRLGKELARLLGAACPPVRHYEPAVPEWALAPEPADMVACIDVLEHIEPDCLEGVLQDLARVTARVGLFTIHTGPAVKTLPDGRNAHLIQEPVEWWLPLLFQHFTLTFLQRLPGGFLVIAEPDCPPSPRLRPGSACPPATSRP